MRVERLSFFVESVQAVPGGWRLEGEPGYHPRHRARPGDRFDRACLENGAEEREVDLVVVELGESFAIVTGAGGDRLGPDDIVSGERLAEGDPAALGTGPGTPPGGPGPRNGFDPEDARAPGRHGPAGKDR